MKNILENFLTVLFDYRESEKITYEGEVVFKLIEEDEIEEYSEVLEKDYVEEVVKLNEAINDGTVSDIKIVDEERGRGLSIMINETEYRYVSDKYSVLELAAKFKSMFDISGKDAMIWLKENAVNYWHDRPYDTKDVKMSLEEKIEEWEERAKDSNIQLHSVDESNGLVIAVFEDEEGKTHKENDLIKDIEEFTSRLGADISKNWLYEKDEDNEDLNVWYNSFILEEEDKEEDDNDDDSFDEIEDSEKFNNKMKSEMDAVMDDLDDDEMFSSGKYLDFEYSDGDNVDIEFELKVNEGEVTEDNVEEFLESINFIDTVIDKMSTVVDDYEGLFLQFADLDLSIDGGTLKITVEFKKVSDVEENEDGEEVNEAVASRPTESINPDELVKVVDMDKVLSSYDGEKLFDLLKRKDLLRKEKDDYIKVEAYPSEPGSVVLVFITEVFGYEAEEVVKVETRVLGSKLLKLFNVKQM